MSASAQIKLAHEIISRKKNFKKIIKRFAFTI